MDLLDVFPQMVTVSAGARFHFLGVMLGFRSAEDAIIVLCVDGALETLGFNIGFRYRGTIVGTENVNLIDEIRRPAHRLHPASHPAPCGRDGNLWAVDDRRVGTPRLSAQPGNLVPDAPCDGTQGLSDFARAARWARREKALQGHEARQAGPCACKGPGSGIHGRSNEALTLVVGAS